MNRTLRLTTAFLALFMVAGVATAATYDSCLDAYDSGEHDSGYYDIDGLDNVYCEMDDNGGGWLRITPELARDELDGELDFEDGESDTDYGFDSSDRPYTEDDEGGHTAHYTFTLPFKVGAFYLQDYTIRSHAASDDSTDIYPTRFVQTDWEDAHGQSVGDVSFGFADMGGPIASFARELDDDDGNCGSQGDDGYCLQYGATLEYPEDKEVYEADDEYDEFRIGWGDEGAPGEGWWPWWSGYIFVREDDGNSNNDDLKIDVTDTDIDSSNDVEITVEVSGEPDDEDTKIRVEYEDDEGGSCSGDWEKAELKGSVSASNEDSGNDPSLDNNDSYQIGSDSGERVIADGDDNEVTFTWDAEDDLGNNPEGEYCVRVTVKADSGEDDVDTYVVDFGDSGDGDIKVKIQDADVESDNDVEFRVEVSGEPDDEDAKLRVEFEDNEGGDCDDDWEKAEIQDGATATNKDGGDDPSVDNGDSYQIGSDSGERVIVDGSDNDLRFKWDAEDDLGNNPEGEYCVRVTVKADSGEDDVDTYVVDFGGSSSSGDLAITEPDDGDTLTDDTPRIEGEASDRDHFVTVYGPENERCVADVNSAEKWSCTLSPALDEEWNEICAVERDEDGDKVDEVCIDVRIKDSSTPTPGPTGSINITSPFNGATLTTNNPALVGSGVPGNVVTVEAVGKSCTATVMNNGGWTCTLTLLPAGTYTVVATQRTPYGQQNGYDTVNFTIKGKQCPVFTQYHKMGESGGEIPQIQEFLKGRGYYTGPVSGYFDHATDQAVKSFQLEFRELILDPWRIPAPTGYWYKTSRKHANFLSGCYETVFLEGIGITY